MSAGTLFQIVMVFAVWGLYMFLFAGYRSQKMKVPWFVWSGFACLIAATVLFVLDIT